jgi:hypothetical protein
MNTHRIRKRAGEEVVVSYCDSGEYISKCRSFGIGEMNNRRNMPVVREYLIRIWVHLEFNETFTCAQTLTQELERPDSPPRDKSGPMIILGNDSPFVLRNAKLKMNIVT